MKVVHTEAYRKKCAEEEEMQKAADAGKAAEPPRQATAARGAGPKAAAPAVPKAARAHAKAHAIAPAAKTLAPGTVSPTAAQAPPPRTKSSAPDATPATP